MLALTFHACITAYIVWRGRILFWQYDHCSWETVAGLQFVNSCLAYYLLGDYDAELLSVVKYKHFYLAVILLWYAYVGLLYFMLTTFYYVTLASVDEGYLYTNLFPEILKYFIMRRTSENYKEFLKKQWYIQNFPGNTWRKKKFNFFLKFTSIILILIHISFWLLLMYSCYFFVHHWLTALILILERNWLYYLICYLKILFVYNFYISLFFDRTSIVWIWLFITPYQTTEEVNKLIFSDYTENDIIQYELDDVHMLVTDPTFMMRMFYAQRFRKYWTSKQGRKANFSLVIFNKRNREVWRHIIPKQWHNWRKKEYGCLITNNYFYRYKIFIRSFYYFFSWDTVYLKVMCNLYFWKKYKDSKQWTWTNAFTITRFKESGLLRPVKNKNRKTLKQYKFK